MLAVLAFVVLQAAGGPSDARQIVVSMPQPIAQVDASKMKGDLVRLAWSPDGSEFYIRTVERDGRGNVKSVRHYIISRVAHAMKGIDQEPDWASRYWSWKSDRMSPAAPSFSITAENRQEAVRATAAPTGGALAKGGTADAVSGSTLGDVASAAEQTQMKNIWTLKVKGETIGEWANEPVTPGFNFSWAPAPFHMLLFARREGGPLTIIDDTGHKQQLAAAKAAILPAWSDDGKRLAWLERKDKNKYDLMTADISAR